MSPGNYLRAQELCESRGGRPGLPVLNSPYGLCGRKATFEEEEEGIFCYHQVRTSRGFQCVLSVV